MIKMPNEIVYNSGKTLAQAFSGQEMAHPVAVVLGVSTLMSLR